MTFRDPLAAALARTEAAEARATAAEAALARATAGAATPARRWTVRSPGYGALVGSAAGLALSVAQGHSRLAHAAVALAACAVVWALCFVRRVPVDGGES